MLLEVSILLSVKKTHHFHQKFPLSYDRNSVFVTMKQVESRETDLLSGEPVSYMHGASEILTQNGGCFEIRVLFVELPLQRYRIYFHIS